MTEAELVQAVMVNRSVLSSLSIGFGVLTLNLIFAAYLLRNLPKPVKATLTFIFLWFIFNSVMRIMITEADYFSLMDQASIIASKEHSPILDRMLTARGIEPGEKANIPNWNYLGGLATLLLAIVVIYLLNYAVWRYDK